MWLCLLLARALSCAAPDQEPVLRTTTRLVQLNQIAADMKGAPVTDLRKHDFALREDVRAEALSVFSVGKGDALARPVHALPAGCFSNRFEYNGGVAGSVTAILFDLVNPSPGYFGRARPQIAKFLHLIDPRFRVGLIALNGSGFTALHDWNFLQKDPAGSHLEGRFDNLDVNVTPPRAAAIAKSGVTHRKLRIQPEPAVMRVVARNALTGSLGSLSIPFHRP